MGKYDFNAEPLPKVKCTSSNCEEDLHCFKPKKKAKESNGAKCRVCEAELVDWDRVQKMDLSDVDATFEFLKKENIRHHFWSIKFSNTFKRNSISVGKGKLKENIINRLNKSIFCKGSVWDGRQTPMTKWNIIFFAQHATATCCRQCIRYWHGVPYDRELTSQELEYFKNLILKYIEEKVGNLPEDNTFQTSISF